MSIYRFPEILDKPSSIHDQIMKLHEELDEIEEAFLSGDYEQAGVECWNLNHATETLSRMLTDDEERARGWIQQTVEDNSERGYYKAVD